MLSASATIDRVSRKLHGTLDTTYNKLKDLDDRAGGSSAIGKERGESEDNRKRAIAVDALVAMTAILRNPFRHGEKEGPTLDFSIDGEGTSDWFSSD